MDILETMYRRITKPFKKDDIPEIELRIPVTRQKIQCNIYDQSNQIISVDNLSKGSILIGILHMKGLKFLNAFLKHFSTIIDSFELGLKVVVPLVPKEKTFCLKDAFTKATLSKSMRDRYQRIVKIWVNRKII